jgi:HprK-related kinase A
MRHQFSVKVGPRGFRIGSAWRRPTDELASLYRHYPAPEDGIADHSVRLEPTSLIRRFIRPSLALGGGFTLPEAAPLPLSLGLIAAEMAMNLQMALGERHFLLLHAATVAKGDRAIILTGESGSGKSTMSAVLMSEGWRFMGDEFALLDPETGMLHPFPRPVSLKNKAMDVLSKRVKPDRFGPLMRDTPKGDLRHLIPDRASLAAMNDVAQPVAILFPRFGEAKATRPVGQGEAFVRLTQASTNYTALSERGFTALSRLVSTVPATAIDYPDTKTGIALVNKIWDAAK